MRMQMIISSWPSQKLLLNYETQYGYLFNIMGEIELSKMMIRYLTAVKKIQRHPDRLNAGSIHMEISKDRDECGMNTLRWRRNGRGGVSIHQLHDCLVNRLFRRRSKKTSKLRVTGLCVGNSPGTGEFPAQMASNVENVSIWWRHHENRSPRLYHYIHLSQGGTTPPATEQRARYFVHAVYEPITWNQC